MKYKKPLIELWYVKVTLIILCIATALLIVKSFIAGYKEGREKAMKERAVQQEIK